MGALDILKLRGNLKRTDDSTAPPQRYNRRHVRSGGQDVGEETSAEVPQLAGAALRNPSAAPGLGVDPAPDQRRAAVPGAGLAALDAGPQPRHRGGVRQDQ